MNLFEKLPKEDVHQLWMYLDQYSDGSALPEENMEYFLRFWKEAKMPFYKMFGEQFILKKEVSFEKHQIDLEIEMDKAIYGEKNSNIIIRDFRKNFKNKIAEIFYDDSHIRYYLQDFVESPSMLVQNEYRGPAILISEKYIKNKRPFQVNPGCKAIKMLGKIVEALDIDTFGYICEKCGKQNLDSDICPFCGKKAKRISGYECFRRAHSLVLNQKRIKGNLCLSIHPLDFLTMSDNNCGWTSCMSWMEEYGDYRMGTIEMMNSSSVVIAYIESKEPFYVCNKEWSNKRWRQLYIVTPELILGNRQYPYSNDILQGTAINWLRELCQKSIGWGPYANEASQIRNEEWNTIDGNRTIYFNLDSNYMYNDIYNERLAYIASSRIEGSRYNLNFSGPAICAGCGEVIYLDEVESHKVRCNRCDGSWRCDCCGDHHSECDSPFELDGYLYCEWCYENETEVCECCGERVRSTNHIYISVDTDNEEISSAVNYSFYIGLCDDCKYSEKNYLEMFGPIYETKDQWGYPRKVFNLANITDEGLERGSLPAPSIIFLRRMRDAKNDKVRLKLIKNFSY